MIQAADIVSALRGTKGAWDEVRALIKASQYLVVENEDFAGLDLSARSFGGCLTFKNCDFSGVRFRACTFFSDFENCNFLRASFFRSGLYGVFERCTFENADMVCSRPYGIINCPPEADYTPPNDAKGLLIRTFEIQPDVKTRKPVYLVDRGDTVSCHIGCTSMRPHKFYERRGHTRASHLIDGGVYPRSVLVPLVTELVQQACTINRDDPMQWRGAPAELEKIETEIFQLLPDQHPVRRLQTGLSSLPVVSL